MDERASFLGASYSAYYHREMPKEDEELVHVGPATPCGEYLRRFWQPVIFLDELKGLPVRVRVMGEDLVAFRDRSGSVGILELHCSHRGTSLEFGQISERGIRCCYHGWLYDVDGRILEMPGEPPDSTLKERLYHGAYPAQVYKGLVFVYMGPPDKKPEFPIYDTYDMRGMRRWSGLRYMVPCNWLQIKDNSMDPAHLSFLHTIDGSDFAKELKLQSELDYMETPIGMISIDTRRVGDKAWVRMTDFICPNIHQFGENRLDLNQEVRFKPPKMTQWSVPVDDTNTMNFRVQYFREDETGKVQVLGLGQSEDRPYEERQRLPGDYDAQVSQRPIAIHGFEHLATTDRGIIMLRRLLREGIRAVQRGESPKGMIRNSAGVLPTYCNYTVIGIREAESPADEKQLLRATGRRVAEEYISNPPGRVTSW